MSTILDPSGTPVPTNKKRIKAIGDHFRQHWSKWLSVLALAVAAWSASTAHLARDQSQTLAKLDFRPDVRINTWFREIAGFPLHVALTNRGPVDAIQVSLTMHSLIYSPSAGKMVAARRSSENNAFFQIIAPRGTKVVNFQKGWLETNARLAAPTHHNVLEIRLQYRRAQDLEAYDVSAFYFVNPDGRWVSESSTSLRDPIYQALKEAAKGYRRTIPRRFLLPLYEDGDFLHENREF